jgi:hypothetical protein
MSKIECRMSHVELQELTVGWHVEIGVDGMRAVVSAGMNRGGDESGTSLSPELGQAN